MPVAGLERIDCAREAQASGECRPRLELSCCGADGRVLRVLVHAVAEDGGLEAVAPLLRICEQLRNPQSTEGSPFPASMFMFAYHGIAPDQRVVRDSERAHSHDTLGNSLAASPLFPCHCLQGAGWDLYQAREEFGRQGALGAAGGWRLSSINADFTYCPTYPAVLAVPASASDTLLLCLRDFRSRVSALRPACRLAAIPLPCGDSPSVAAACSPLVHSSGSHPSADMARSTDWSVPPAFKPAAGGDEARTLAPR